MRIKSSDDKGAFAIGELHILWKSTLSHTSVGKGKRRRGGHLFKIEMMLLCNSISPGAAVTDDDLSDRKEGRKLQTPALLPPFFAREGDKMAMPNYALPFLPPFKSPPPFSAECRQNIKTWERYRITRSPLPKL